jgi:hypothetical protein
MNRGEALTHWQSKYERAELEQELAALEMGELCPGVGEGLEGPGIDCGNCGASHTRCGGGLCPGCFDRLTLLRATLKTPQPLTGASWPT